MVSIKTTANVIGNIKSFGKNTVEKLVQNQFWFINLFVMDLHNKTQSIYNRKYRPWKLPWILVMSKVVSLVNL